MLIVTLIVQVNTCESFALRLQEGCLVNKMYMTIIIQ